MKKIHAEILNLFRKRIFLSKTIREISLMLGKGYPNVYNAVNELEKKGIIKIRKVGNAKMCEILLSQNAISFLSFLDEQESLSRNIPNINKILDLKELFDDIIIVAGSYAKGKQKKGSDIDLVIITKEDAFKKQKFLEELTDLFLPRMHIIAISQKDFIGMLLEKKANFGKEVFNNCLIFRNSSRYYQLLKEAIENGFRG